MEEFRSGPTATRLIRDELIPDLRARVAVGMPPRISDEIDRFMREAGLLVAMPDKRASGFILGDCGGIRVSESNDSNVYHSWLPVSREIILGPTMNPENVTYMNLYRKDVNRITRAIFDASNVVVAKRKSDLDYVVRLWNRAKPGLSDSAFCRAMTTFASRQRSSERFWIWVVLP